MNTHTALKSRKTPILHHCVTAVLLLHLACVGVIQFIAPKFTTIFKDVMGEDAQLPQVTRFFIASPNLILLFISLLFVIWAVVFVYKKPSRKRSIILLITLVVYTLLLATSAFIAFALPLQKITPGMTP